ncbi:MAG: carbon-nitrogen hydrolase family protein [Desulfomonilia bacterium]
MAEMITAAAVQMKAELGNVEANLLKADTLIEEATSKGAKIIILPEFFTSAAAFHPRLLEASLPLVGKAYDLLVGKARAHQVYVGGSYLASRDGEVYNTFVLAMPDGRTATHDKDQPTMWENCYYIGGDDDGILNTPLGPMGAVLCWEFVRNRTVQRLLGKVDLVVGGSCWWTVPSGWPPVYFWNWHNRKNKKLMSTTPATFSRLLGVPVIHAAHAGDFRASMPLLPLAPYSSSYLGETQIVDRTGVILARMKAEEGEGVIAADITIGRVTPSLAHSTTFWIPKLPLLFRVVWAYQNAYGRRYYRKAKSQGRLRIAL